MSLRVAVLALVVSLATTAHAQSQAELDKLANEKPRILLVTMGVGALIWERHGHIALCVEYDDPSANVCYNYGIGDFEHPLGMAWGFFRGTQSFWVGKQKPRSMLDIYTSRDRSVWIQPLPLTQDQKMKVLQKLEFDVLEENKHYAYDHFEDNCTTRIRDIIDNVTDHALSKMTEPTDGKTFRDLARDGFYGMRIPLLITDIAMGRSTDRVPTYYERMFLPQYLREAVEKKWNIKPVEVYKRVGPPPLDDGPSGRVLFALLIIVLTSPAWLSRLKGKYQRAGLAAAIAPYVFLGTILWFLAIISPLPYVRGNETCLLWLPTDALVLWLGPEKRKLYARGRIAMLGLLFVLHILGVIKQPIIAPMLWPLIPMAVIAWLPEKTVAKVDAKPANKSARKKR